VKKAISVVLVVVGVLAVVSSFGSLATGYANMRMTRDPGEWRVAVVLFLFTIALGAAVLAGGRLLWKPMFGRLCAVAAAACGSVLIVDESTSRVLLTLRQSLDESSVLFRTHRWMRFILYKLELQVYTLEIGVAFLVAGVAVYVVSRRRRGHGTAG
jgi:hypothetical protein